VLHEGQRRHGGRRGRDHVPAKPVPLEQFVDVVAQAAAARDADVLGLGIARNGQVTVAERVPGAHGQHQMVLGDRLRRDLGKLGRARPDLEIDVAVPQVQCVHRRLRQQPQRDLRSRSPDLIQQERPDRHRDRIMALQREGPRQRGQVQLALGAEHRLRLANQGMDLRADPHRVRRRGHGAAGPDQDLVSGDVADPPQRPAHRRRRQVHPVRRRAHAALFEQRVERRQQVQI
jgi:hypothetical protein